MGWEWEIKWKGEIKRKKIQWMRGTNNNGFLCLLGSILRCFLALPSLSDSVESLYHHTILCYFSLSLSALFFSSLRLQQPLCLCCGLPFHYYSIPYIAKHLYPTCSQIPRFDLNLIKTLIILIPSLPNKLNFKPK